MNTNITALELVRERTAYLREYYSKVLDNAERGDFAPYKSNPDPDFHGAYDITFLAILAQQRKLSSDVFFVNERCFSLEICDSTFKALTDRLRRAPQNYCCSILHYEMSSRGHWYLYLVKKIDANSLFVLSCDSTNYDLTRDPSPEVTNQFIQHLDTQFPGKYSVLKLMDVIGFEKGVQTDFFSCGQMAMDAFKRLNVLFGNVPNLFPSIEGIQNDPELQELFKAIFLRNSQRKKYMGLQPLCDYRQSSIKGVKIFDQNLFWKNNMNLNNIRKLVSWLAKAEEFLGTLSQTQWEQITARFTLVEATGVSGQTHKLSTKDSCTLL